MHATQNPARPETNPETAATLRRAALYLIRHGWTQNRYYTWPSVSAAPDIFPAANVVGALVLAITGEPLAYSDLVRGACEEQGHYYAALVECDHVAVYLAEWLGLTGGSRWASLGCYDPALIARDLLEKWNNSPWQDQAHVIDGLLCAAADADGTVYDPDMHRPYATDFAALGLGAGAR